MAIASLVLFKICLLQVHISSIYGSNTDGGRYKITDAYTTCSKGWYSYGDMCYNLGGKTKLGRLYWIEAQKSCKENHGGDLATVYSQELQDFLTATLLMRAESNVWIGLHDRDKETDYRWVDGTPYGNFTCYEPEEPSGPARDSEDCIEMVFKSMKVNRKTGQWNDADCNNQYQFICQKPKGETDPIKGHNLDPLYCKSEQGIGWRFENSCFHLITESKTWSDAEESCVKEYNGHLATLDYRVNVYLKYVLRDVREQIWVGVKIKEETQQKWSSDWLVSFENWPPQKEYVEGTCLLLDENKSWLIQSCEKKLWYLCEYSNATVSPPVLKPPAQDVRCPVQPPGWRDLGGERCYFFDILAFMTWNEAYFSCMRRGGTLASIHSQAEVDILFQFVQYNYGRRAYIGLYRQTENEEFVWADGSKVDFTNWGTGEPNLEREHCTELRVENMKWNDQACTLQRGYICSIPKTISKARESEEIQTQLSCKNTIIISTLIAATSCGLIFSIVIGLVLYHFKICNKGYVRVKKQYCAKFPVPPFELDDKARYHLERKLTDTQAYENIFYTTHK